MKVYLANPRGFCAGVDRAIEIVERALQQYGAPIYVRHEVVHNRFVVSDLKQKGAVFVEEIADVPTGAVVIFSAHGVAKQVKVEAKNKQAIVFDATCPLVTKVHNEVIKNQQNNGQMILIGHANHPEVEGTLGQSNDKSHIHLIETKSDVANLSLTTNGKLAYTTQTTLSVDDTQDIVDTLKKKFPNIIPPRKKDICYATQNRQNAVKKLIKLSDILLVLGSANSSNSNRLKEIAIKQGKPAYLIDGANEIQDNWLKGVDSVGVTAGASAPEILVKDVVAYLKQHGANEINEVLGSLETITFPVPKELR